MPENDRRQEHLSVLDAALKPYSSVSALALLRAALDSPGCARFHDHLLLAWTRALAAPDRDGRAAAADELVVTDQSRRHTVHATVSDEGAAQRVLDGLVLDTDHTQLRPGRRYRSLLPTGHLLSVSVEPT